jgi:hypothetical protein
MKILLLFSFFVALSLNIKAQNNFIFKTLSGTDVTGDTVHFTGDTSEYEVLSELIVRNVSAAAYNVKMKRILLNVVPGTTNLICWGGTCWGESTSVTPTSQNIPANSETSGVTNFVGHFRPHHLIGTNTIMYVAFNVSNANDSAYVIVSYDIFDPTSINHSTFESTAISNPVPNPANGFTKFSYNMEAGSTGSVSLFSLTGSLIKKFELKDASGNLKISTAELPSGLYFYSYTVDGKTVKTNRLIVNH